MSESVGQVGQVRSGQVRSGQVRLSVRSGVSESSNNFSSGKSEVLKVAWQSIYLVVKNNRNSQCSFSVCAAS